MLVCAGTDYKLAPLEIRERLAFNEQQAAEAIKKISSINNVSGCVVLSTCNRSELYISSCGDIDAAGLLIKCSGADEKDIRDKIKLYTGDEAVYHLFETACGLNSAMHRESQIITQISRSADLSRELECMDSELDVLFRTAVSSARKAASTANNERGLSSAFAAVERLSSLCNLRGKKCLVIGNGQVGRLAAHLLRDRGAEVTITLRVYKNGENIIPSGCSSIPYNERAKAIAKSDILLSATKSPHYTVTADMMNNIKKPSYIIDLAVPRDIEPSAAEGAVYFNIDDFSVKSEGDLSKVYEIIEDGIAEYTAWYNYRTAIGDIESIKDIMAQRIVKSTGYDEELVREVAARSADMIFGGMKSVITPLAVEQCRKKIRERARL